ncbi:hypothetical protein BJ170DRAFT_729283 [Xylariales sp. AK1849]|nr:hypothetical protein BJ170DRAFT_729283 [Xylariales sp. AK1849]
MPNIRSPGMTPDVTDDSWLFLPSADTTIAEDAAIFPRLSSPMQAHDVDVQSMHWSGNFCGSASINPVYQNHTTAVYLETPNETVRDDMTSLPSFGSFGSHLRVDDGDTHDPVETYPASTALRLASLNVALHECASKLPFQARTRPAPSTGYTTDNSAHSSRRTAVFAIDELFRLTTDFINFMEGVPLEKYDMSATLPPTGVIGLLPVANTYTEPSSSVCSDVDEATMSMVVSCHCRLVETYVSLFEMMQACISIDKVSSASPVSNRDSNWAIILPELQLGSIAATPALRVDNDAPISSAATASMYMIMVTMISAQLWERVAAVTKRGGDGPRAGCKSDLVVMMWATMAVKTNRISQMIHATKHLL